MEYLLDSYLNAPIKTTEPEEWESDEYICWLIETGQVPPMNENHPAFVDFQARTAA